MSVPPPAHLQAPQVATGRLLGVGAGIVLLVAASLLLVDLFLGPRAEARRESAPQSFPSPSLQTQPAGDLAQVQRRQTARLQGVADPEHPGIRMPIEAAMARIVARGALAYAPLEPAPPSAAKNAGEDAP